MRARTVAFAAVGALGLVALLLIAGPWPGRDGAREGGAAPGSPAALDGDGRVSSDARPSPPGGPGEGGGSQGGGGGDPIGGPTRSPAEATEAFLAFDANGDGALDRTEAPSQHQSLVTRADANRDGAASREEILALIEAEAGGSDSARP